MTKARTLADNFAADINGITAGTGITGGGTSGTVTITNDMATAINAKGDLVVGTGADAYARLAVASTAGYLLTVDSAETTGLKWSAPASGGKVLQVVYADYETQTTITSATSYSDTGGTISITPSSTSSKVLILCALTAGLNRSSNTGQGGTFRLMRGTTAVFTQSANISSLFTRMGTGDGSQTIVFGLYAINYLDSPNTTSSTTYKLQGKVLYTDNSGSLVCQSETSKSTMIAMEIGA